MKNNSVALQLKDVVLTLPSHAGAVEILKGISLDIKKGETVSIVGPSGSGKSSLMMILGGLQNATSGDINVAGHDLQKLDEEALTDFRRDNIGIVFQNFHLVPTMTALENVALPLEFKQDEDAFKQAEEALKAVGLGHRLDHYPSQLSGGEQQRTALARAIVTKPKLLLADEPTGNLDQETGETVVSLLFSLAKETGLTLVLITHDPKLAAKCERQIKLVDGQLNK